jgi:hypothetical protein
MEKTMPILQKWEDGMDKKEGVKILCDGYDKPLNDAIKIQEALSPLGYIVQGFEKEGGLFLLRLMPTIR